MTKKKKKQKQTIRTQHGKISKSSDVADHVEERGMNIDSVNIKTQEDDNPVEGKHIQMLQFKR